LVETIPAGKHRQVRETTTLRGYIDGVTPIGVIEGWALDEQMSWRPLHVKIRCKGEWIASGLAHHHREDLLALQIGTGWCGFRLRSDRSADEIRHATLYLVGISGVIIVKSENIALLPDIHQDLSSVEDVIAADPTVVRSVEHLRGCEPLFTQYIRSRGIDAFVRVAYVYMLGRPADEAGLRLYGNRLRRGTHHPFDLLQILAASEEFLARRPELVAPTQSSFPFLID
jgi:hypothetical protein